MKKKRATRGLVSGKFLPLHRGHQYLIDFARRYADDITIVLCSLESEEIPGSIRERWLRELFPGVTIVHLENVHPELEPSDPQYIRRWCDTIKSLSLQDFDYFFASEEYGFEVEKRLGCTYIPVDHLRELVHVSGTDIRKNPPAHWEFLPDVVRPYFLKRVCLFGVESTGKSTLTINLAKHFQTRYVHEYARSVLETKKVNLKTSSFPFEDVEVMARAQLAAEEALATQANRVLFIDSDLVTLGYYSQHLFGRVPDWVEEQMELQRHDLYIVPDIDVPYVDDPLRFFPSEEERKSFMAWCIEELEKRQRPYVIVRGSWDERLKQAIEATETCLTRKRTS